MAQKKGTDPFFAAKKGSVPFFSVIGHSGSGKTTLIEQLIPVLARAGLAVGTAKHHHDMPALDTPGKDSTRHAGAGARVVALAGRRGLAIFARSLRAREPDLPDLLARAAAGAGTAIDLFLAEGFTHQARTAIRLRDAAGRLRRLPRGCRVLAELDLHAASKRPGQRPRFPARAVRDLARVIRTWLVNAKKLS